MNGERTTKPGSLSPMIVAVEMGYGHLRAAYTLAELFGTDMMRMDLPPLAGPAEAAAWRALRVSYNALSRACDWPVAGQPARRALEKITEIAPLRKHTPASFLTHLADSLTGAVLGRRLRALAATSERPVLATYPLAALAARHAPGAKVFCLATDTDVNRAWAPAKARQAHIDYFAPVDRVAERLQSFGVPDRQIHLTGFPLPAKLIAQAPDAVARRLQRLDPAGFFHNQASGEIASVMGSRNPGTSHRPIMMTVAIGGAGAQTRQVGLILRSLRDRIVQGKVRLTLVAGTRREVARILEGMVVSNGLQACHPGRIEILLANEPNDYFRQFEECLADTDVLWTKPSELIFYAALGLPILLASPVGGQEHANRDWLLSKKAALDCGDPAKIDQRLESLLATGELSRVAWNAYSSLDRNGSDRICAIMESIGLPKQGSESAC